MVQFWKKLLVLLALVDSLVLVDSQGTAIRVATKDGSALGKLNSGSSELQSCTEVHDLSRYANCELLSHGGECKDQPEKMKHYCPRTCGFCEGGVGTTTKASAPDGPPCKTSLHGCCKDGETQAKGTNFAGCPEKCFDTPNYPCSFYKEINFCKVYQGQMLDRCPRTCEMCLPPGSKKKIVKERPEDSETECIDVWEPKTCKRLNKFKLCTVEKWSKKMTKKCRKTCRKCLQHAPALLSIAEPCTKDDTCCWDKSRRVNGICPDCKDSFSSDFCQRFFYDCNKNSRVKSVQIRLLCPKTCGMCKSQDACRDDIVYWDFCLQWKEQGECKKSPEMMSAYCKKTCDFCS